MNKNLTASILHPILCCFLVNMYVALEFAPWLLFMLVPLYLFVLFFAGVFRLNTQSNG